MQNHVNQQYMLSDLLGLRALINGKKIGTIDDIIVTDAPRLPEVTHVRITRPFGYPALMGHGATSATSQGETSP